MCLDSMFSYYGSKSKLYKLYPKPKMDLIIEPFCGAAWYSFDNYHKKVWVNDKYQVIYNIWDWLINKADKYFILDNLDYYIGDDISKLDLPNEFKDLLGFCINTGSSTPKNIVQKWVCQSKINYNWASTTNFQLKRVANELHRVKHWKCSGFDYTDIPNIEATWFIDPPYQHGGEYYKLNTINYNNLREWCQSRKGQVIVCENTNADWLDFRPLHNIKGQRKKTTEAIWTNLS